MADESKSAAPADTLFDIRGPRGALTEAEATTRCAPILAEGRTAFTRAVLSTWAFDEASAVVVASALAKLPGLVDVDMSDIIAGREEAIGLKVYEVLTAVLKEKRLQSINLSDNALGPKGVASCRDMLAGQEDLQHLYLCRNGVSAEAMRTVADLLLFRTPTNMKTLHLFNNMCGGDGAKALADIILQSPQLEDVRFSSCRGTEDGGLALVESLAATTKLRKLELSDNMFSPEIGVALAKVLAQQKGLVHLDVSDISLGDEGVQAICESVRVNCPELELVSFAANDLTDESAPAVARLVRELPKLRVLRLEDNDELTNAFFRRLARAVSRRTGDTLEHINLSTTGIRTSAFRVLAAALEAKPRFQTLKIDECGVSEAAVGDAREGLVPDYDPSGYESDMTDDEGGDTEDEDDAGDAGAADTADTEVDALASGIAAM